MKERLYVAITAMVFLCGGHFAEAQTKPLSKPDLISSKSLPAPAPLSPATKLARIKAALKGQPQKTIDSATLGGPLCSLSVQTPQAGICALRLFSPFSVFFDLNFALMSDATETSDSTVMVYFTSPQPAGIYILDFAISITDYVDGRKAKEKTKFQIENNLSQDQAITIGKKEGHLLVPVEIKKTANAVSVQADSNWYFHSVQISKVN